MRILFIEDNAIVRQWIADAVIHLQTKYGYMIDAVMATGYHDATRYENWEFFIICADVNLGEVETGADFIKRYKDLHGVPDSDFIIYTVDVRSAEQRGIFAISKDKLIDELRERIKYKLEIENLDVSQQEQSVVVQDVEEKVPKKSFYKRLSVLSIASGIIVLASAATVLTGIGHRAAVAVVEPVARRVVDSTMRVQNTLCSLRTERQAMEICDLKYNQQFLIFSIDELLTPDQRQRVRNKMNDFKRR